MARASWPTILCLTLVLSLGAGPAFGGAANADRAATPVKPSPNPMNVATDVLIMRPVGLVMIPVTALIYVLGYPFAKASGSEREAYQALLGQTVDFTFRRPLGQGPPFE